ncbi:MAG: hypothetical protein WAQ98_17600 [Blastocatellia bacterium]
MIQNDKELEVTQQRIAYFQQLLAQFRVTARPEEFPILASSYISEIEIMQKEVMQYLSSHVSSNAA